MIVLCYLGEDGIKIREHIEEVLSGGGGEGGLLDLRGGGRWGGCLMRSTNRVGPNSRDGATPPLKKEGTPGFSEGDSSP